MKPTVFILVGPTGSGKTALALDLKKHLPIEVISADSLQVFRHLDIGTAKPTPEERALLPHHLMDCLDPDQEANAAWFSEKAREAISDVLARKNIPLVVGGSGFYLRTLEHPPLEASKDCPPIEDLAQAYSRLEKEDPQAAARIHPNDTYRIERAIAVLQTGQRPSDLWRKTQEQDGPFVFSYLGLSWQRPDLYKRINQRMDEMFERGLLEETTKVLEQFPKARKRLEKAIGYHQALSFLEQRLDLDTAKEEAKKASRRYAKRQITWFGSEPRIRWTKPNEALNLALKQLSA